MFFKKKIVAGGVTRKNTLICNRIKMDLFLAIVRRGGGVNAAQELSSDYCSTRERTRRGESSLAKRIVRIKLLYLPPENRTSVDNTSCKDQHWQFFTLFPMYNSIFLVSDLSAIWFDMWAIWFGKVAKISSNPNFSWQHVLQRSTLAISYPFFQCIIPSFLCPS